MGILNNTVMQTTKLTVLNLLPAQHYVQRGEGIVFNGTFEECQVELYKIYSELDTHRDVTYSKDNCAVIEDGVVVASIKSSQ